MLNTAGSTGSWLHDRDNMAKINRKYLNPFIVFIIAINVILILFRIHTGSPDSYDGNMLSLAIIVVIFGVLLILFIMKRYDYFIMLWLSFYFACPVLKVPFTAIGSLGLINAIFIPLMLLTLFNPKNRYYLLMLLIILVSVFNLGDVTLRILISRAFEFIAPFLFFYFASKKCRDPKLIFYATILIALINIPLSLYELGFQPSWGVTMDWRGARIYGNLFWPNSYTVYLLPAIMILYAGVRKRLTKGSLVLLAILLSIDLLTFSRAGLLCLAVSIIVFELAGRGVFKISAKNFILIFLLISSILIYSNVIDIINPRYTPSTLTERISIWDTILPFIHGKLIFGNGLGSYELYRSQVLRSLSPHNYYLMVMFELGIIGLSVMLIFVFTMFRDLYQRVRDEEAYPYGRLGISILSGIVVISMVGGAGFAQVVSLDSWVVLGCCLLPAASGKRSRLSSPYPEEAAQPQAKK